MFMLPFATSQCGRRLRVANPCFSLLSSRLLDERTSLLLGFGAEGRKHFMQFELLEWILDHHHNHVLSIPGFVLLPSPHPPPPLTPFHIYLIPVLFVIS
jgi:hypothetical protein